MEKLREKARPAEQPTMNVESPFELDELFFSVTDGKGIIQSFNDVFMRVAEYGPDELQGQPHNIIRHPDMPRAVFRLLWDYLLAEKSIAAYVKNRSRTGKYYWVLAYASPVPGGYVSVRMKPSSDLLDTVQELYAEMLQRERACAAGGGSSRDVMDTSSTVLLDRLGDLGFADYDSFMHHAIVTEMRSRDALLRSASRQDRKLAAADDSELHIMLNRSVNVDRALAAMFSQIDTLNQTISVFREVRSHVNSLSRNVHRLALNAAMQASSLGDDGRAVATLAQFLGSGAQHLLDQVRMLTDGAEELMPRVFQLMFDISIAKLQMEMIVDFLQELDRVDSEQEGESSGDNDGVARDSRIQVLQEGFSASAGNLVQRLNDVHHRFHEISSSVNQVLRCSKELSFVHVTGRVEAARLPVDCSFGQILESVSGYLESTDERLRHFISECARVVESLDACDAPAAELSSYIESVGTTGVAH